VTPSPTVRVLKEVPNPSVKLTSPAETFDALTHCGYENPPGWGTLEYVACNPVRMIPTVCIACWLIGSADEGLADVRVVKFVAPGVPWNAEAFTRILVIRRDVVQLVTDGPA
jgi:hypothetical protein